MEETKNDTNSVELMNLYGQGKYKELDSSIADITQNLYIQWRSGKDSIQQSLQQLSLDMSEVYSYIQGTSGRLKSLFNLGTLAGALESFTRVIRDRNREQMAESKMQEYIISIKHLEKVITVLGMHGIISHRDLSEELGLNPSTLTEAMKKILDTGAVQVGISGKYKMYSLTDFGVQMDKFIRKKIMGRKSTDEVLKVVKGYLSYFIDEDEKNVALNHLIESLDCCPEVSVHVNDRVSLQLIGEDSTLFDESDVKAIMQLPGTNRKRVILNRNSPPVQDPASEIFISFGEYQPTDNYICAR